MEKILFLCVFLYRIVQITSSEHEVTLLRRQLNENITLNCNITGKFAIAWYHQNPDSGRPMLLIHAYITSGTHAYVSQSYEGNQNSRMGVNVDKASNTASLVISGLMESDSGLYFCGTSTRSVMQFGKSIRLQIEEHNVTPLRCQLNENITLNCNINGKFEMAWYHQKPDSGRPMLLIYAIITHADIFQAYEVSDELTVSEDEAHSDVEITDREDEVHYVTEPPEDIEITDDFFVKTGKKLKLDVLLPDARQVLHQNKTTAEWKEVWKRDRKKRVRVTHDRMNDRDGTLTITEFMADDAGTYRVMDFEGEILITVTVADEKSSVDV
ncbi:hypothetical protein ROHU_000656 [Labeo rohita]|uniref:Ig-like domain-containing protein n=1 Tax=Labeo rohita TaxID=84645 RepID=A0A498P4J1_LABRO|nr:hypothetical protein ROHU_000656 [Labeo rohita]